MSLALVAKILEIAKAEVGTHETRAGGHWVNDSKYNRWFGRIPGYGQDGYGYPWCAVFVAWVADQASAAALYPKTAGCETAVAWFKRQNRFSEYPAIGAQVFYGPGGGTHTGIVVAFTDSTITTVEGNTNADGSAEGDGVYLKTRARKSANVYGYGYPAFPEGIVSADPAWADKAPKPAGIRGVDVSSYQPEDYALDGVDFVMVKATEGAAYTNPRHAAQVKRARDNGRIVGHYHFLRPGNMHAQVDRFLAVAAAKPGDVLALDWEDRGVSCADKDAALRYLKGATSGAKVLLYCNREFWLNVDTTSYAADGLWIADYVAAGLPRIEAAWLVHQFTDRPVDTNITHWRTRADMAAWAAWPAVKPKPKPTTPAKPSVSLSKLVAAAKANPPAKGTPVTYAGVRTVELALVKAGLLSARLADGHFGSDTVRAYAAWQRSKAGGGYTGKSADGVPGLASLRKLAAKYGFTVTA